MKKRRTFFLSEYVTDQYPVEKFKILIFITLDIVENFLLVLENGFDYDSRSICSYAKKYGSTKTNNSKIESIFIKNMQEQENMESFLNKYYIAYNSLNDEEKNLFNSSFIDRLSDIEIIDKYNTNSRHIRMVRNSAVVRFSLKLGLNSFVNQV